MTRIAVIGGGWAGLAAAVEAVSLGAAVTLFEMAPTLGGRARSLEGSEPALDTGQHNLIGAYAASLALMRRVGADPEADLLRMPLRLRYPDRDTLTLPGGPPTLAFLRGAGNTRLGVLGAIALGATLYDLAFSAMARRDES